jgi:hypothetical protein
VEEQIQTKSARIIPKASRHQDYPDKENDSLPGAHTFLRDAVAETFLTNTTRVRLNIDALDFVQGISVSSVAS